MSRVQPAIPDPQGGEPRPPRRAALFIVVVAALLLAAAVALVLRARSEFEGAAFAPGDRVVVAAAHGWAAGSEGTVQLPPPEVAVLDGWDGHLFRPVPGAPGGYWVRLDRPRTPPDGPPRTGLVVDERLLRKP